jgi:putative inorganic carbon (hco3(-)) transporter
MFENRPQRMKQIVNSRWFPVLDLFCASAASLTWFLRPELSWWLLLLALLPWFIRTAAGYFPFKRTPFDLLLLIFLITAGLGVWVSYDTPGAWGKFWVILGSIFLYYALAAQPKANLVFVAGTLSALGVVVALTVLFDSSLQEYTADLGIVQRSIDWWGAVRPPWQVKALSPNVSGGILALLLPFSLLSSIGMIFRGRVVVGIGVLVTSFLITVALFMTSSRGAWFAIVTAIVVVLFLYLGRSLIRSLPRTYKIVLAVTLLAIALLSVGFGIFNSSEIANVMDLMPGFPYGTGRLDLINNSWDLLTDFPFTGGGLRAFPGLYSQYILHIPYLFLEYSHNLYMDLALEQGVVGWLSFMVILFGSMFMSVAIVLKNRDLGQALYIHLAVIAGLVVVLVHGLIDNPLYGMQGTPLLFLLPGIGAALYKNDPSLRPEVKEGFSYLKYRPVWGSLLFLFFILLYFGQSSVGTLTSGWYANLGSVYMSKAELTGFPADSLDALPEESSYQKARAYFLSALSYNEMNQTANYRLGLMSSQERDFPTAVQYLERAYQGNSRHKGIQKALGYNYVWNDSPEVAAEYLSELPEASHELEVYVWWWETQKRPDLAAQSRSALEYLP